MANYCLFVGYFSCNFRHCLAEGFLLFPVLFPGCQLTLKFFQRLKRIMNCLLVHVTRWSVLSEHVNNFHSLFLCSFNRFVSQFVCCVSFSCLVLTICQFPGVFVKCMNCHGSKMRGTLKNTSPSLGIVFVYLYVKFS